METTSKRKSGTTDLTVGKPLFQILRFALPLVLGTLFQQLYSFADTVIVGRCLGTDALGAVGTTYSLNFLILGFVQGACVGFGIPVAETFGAKDQGGLRKYLFNGALLCVVLSVVFTLFTTLMAGPLLQLIHTPEELYADAVLYIRIIFLGIPATVLYNYASSVLRAMGDSQHPFYFLLAASVLNIGLDYLLIVSMGMGVEYSVSAIGAVIMQDAINLLGSTAVAAQTAGEKIRQMFTLPMESVGMAMATYVGQNHGAHRTDRIKQGIKDGCTIQLTYCVAAWVVIFFVKPYAVGLVLGDADPAVTAGAIQYLAIMSLLFCFHGLLMIFRNTLQGLGYSVQAIISGVGELIGRSLGGLLAVKTGLGYVGICLSNPFAWGLAMLYCMFMVRRMLKRED